MLIANFIIEHSVNILLEYCRNIIQFVSHSPVNILYKFTSSNIVRIIISFTKVVILCTQEITIIYCSHMSPPPAYILEVWLQVETWGCRAPPVGGSKMHQLLLWISSEAYPIRLGYIERHKKFQGPSWSGSAASRYVISVTKIQRIFKTYNGGENSTRFSIFLFWNKFLTKIEWTGVIAEVQTVV